MNRSVCAWILATLAWLPGAAEAGPTDSELVEADPSAEEGEQQDAAGAPSVFEESITVEGIRAGADVPVTKTDLDREQIEALSYGQDVPQLLQYTPSTTWYSDSGIGSNYSYLSLRGIQQTRINLTFDGAPLNDPAEHALFFNNFHDFANTVDSVQIQRGVGTSSVGAPSYGGSINFASRPPAQERGGDVRLVLGSYETRRASVAYESGILGNGFSIGGRISLAETDGYRDNSGSEHQTYFLNMSWQGERSALRFVSFSGNEESQLAFLAVDPDTLAENQRFNPLDEEERDNFGQDFAQLKYTRDLGSGTLLTASLYYNGADGYFLLWDDPVAQSELLEFGIDQGFVGSMVTISKSSERLSATVGAHYNDFSGDHTLDVEAGRVYENTGFKTTANLFGKLEYELGSWLLFGDLQLRQANFRYRGDVAIEPVDWSFVDPKVGVRRFLSPGLSVYASVGRAQREPTRLDLLAGEDNATVPHDLEAVRPEEVLDYELGVNWSTPRVALQAGLYAMEFTNEIALTGELSEVGLPLRTNVDDSYRRGLEVDLSWKLSPEWTLLHSANLSRNRISEWTQYTDVFDTEGNFLDSVPITYSDVPPLLSPELLLNLGLTWSRGPAQVGVVGRYVDDAHLDNTGLDEFRAPSYTNVDLRASMEIGRRWSARPRLTLFVNNLFDNLDQFPSGYSYQFLIEDPAGRRVLDGIPFFYPLASRNALLSIELGL
jgi:iron complex outermembrane receptor protein